MTADAYAFPCSFAQQRLWFLDRLTPDTNLYNISAALRLSTPLDARCLECAVNEMVRRHEALRTTFRAVDGEPEQIIAAQLHIGVESLDLRALPPEAREAEALRLASEDARLPFDLERGPLLRVSLIELGARAQVLLIATHHIVSDGWSMQIFFDELGVLYDAFFAGESSPLAELDVQYADFAVWQREWLAGEELERQAAWWRKQLANLPPLELPADRKRPPLASYAGAREPLRVDEHVTAALAALGRAENATLFMTLLAAFQVLLWRYSGQEDVAVGSLSAGRNRAETEGLIGFFVNTLVLRTNLGGNPTFRELVARVRDTALGAYAHSDLPFEKLVELLHPERDLSRNPLVQVTFQLFNPPRLAHAERGGTQGLLDTPKGTAKFDIALEMWERGAELEGRMEYSTDLYDDATVRRMLAHFTALLASVAANPDERISNLPLLTAAERSRTLVEWNRREQPYPRHLCLHELFEQQAAATPDALALICGRTEWTYDELNRRANAIAWRLRESGTAPDTLVGVRLERTPKLVATLLGILKAGAAYLPLDPQYPEERQAFMLADACATVADFDSFEAVSENPPPSAAPHNLAYVLYTSGSTGRPKGVAIEHRNAAALIHWARGFYSAADLAWVLASTSVCFDLSVFEIFVPLASGGAVVLVDNALELPTAPARERVTLINTVPSAIAELAAAGAIPPSVRTVNLAGEPLGSELVEEVFRHSQVEQIFNLYGPTEDTTYSTCARIARGERWQPTIGRPIGNRKAYVLDSEMEPVPPGVTGELYLGGDGVARGYLHRPEVTAEKFIPSPFVSGTRLYRTGDLARYRACGEIEFLGRADQQIKLRGYRIELGEIEAALRSLPEVRDAVTVVREGSIVAYAAPNEGSDTTGPALRRALERTLPRYMLPAAVLLLDRLPMTPNGKVDRQAIAARETAPPHAVGARTAPRTELERSIARIWQEVLAVPKVGLDDNFFELGGHSLLLLRLQSRLALEVAEVPVLDLFRHPTVEALALHLAHGRGEVPAALAAAEQRAQKQRARRGERPLVKQAGRGAPWANG
jgi:amino acid adenylation domain-containing protein